MTVDVGTVVAVAGVGAAAVVLVSAVVVVVVVVAAVVIIGVSGKTTAIPHNNRAYRALCRACIVVVVC